MIGFIPGPVIAALTFPGVIVHEAGHFIFCRLFKLAILDVCFFQFGDPAGYVVHEVPKDFSRSFFISMGPFFVNTFFCIVFCGVSFIPVWELSIDDPLAYLFFWLGISIGMHAFPSNEDMKVLWDLAPAAARRANVLALVTFPLVGLVYGLNFLRAVWADLLYALGVGVFLPIAVFRAFA